MSSLLTSGQVGNIGLNHMKAIRKMTQEKWESLGFLDGLKGHVKENIAQLYENQASTMLTEATTADASGSFETVVFPIVRRVFSKLLANDIVSVQALNMPIGKLFYFVPVTAERYDQTSGNFGDPWGLGDHTGNNYSAHTGMGNQLPTCVNLSGCAAPQWYAKNLYDLYYNDGLFDASKGTIAIKTATGVPVTMLSNGTFSATTTFPLATDGTTREVMLQVSGFTNFNGSNYNGTLGGGFGTSSSEGSQIGGPDGDVMDTESFLAGLYVTNQAAIKDGTGTVVYPIGSSIPFRLVTQKYGQGIVSTNNAVSDAYGVMYIGLDLSNPISPNASFSSYDGYVGASGTTSAYTANSSSFVISYAVYDTLEMETEMGEVSFRLDQVVVAVTERKLRATWSPELAQDVSAFHNIDAEAELTAMLSEQVAAEIDREILRDLRKAAAWQMRWDWSGWRKASSAASPYTQKDWNQTLITKINQCSAQIHKSTLRGGANFIVVSSEISAIFDDLEYFHVSDASPEQDQYNMGIERIGSLSGRYQVYRDPYAPYYSCIIGHKGKSLLDTGYVYAPYVPLQLTPTMYNPFNFAPVKGIMTRYAKKSVNNRFYAHLRLDNVVHFNLNELR
jgi:hypothetical protein